MIVGGEVGESILAAQARYRERWCAVAVYAVLGWSVECADEPALGAIVGYAGRVRRYAPRQQNRRRRDVM